MYEENFIFYQCGDSTKFFNTVTALVEIKLSFSLALARTYTSPAAPNLYPQGAHLYSHVTREKMIAQKPSGDMLLLTFQKRIF
jgi:hypothetical protein